MNDNDLVRLQSLLACIVNIERGAMRTKNGEGRETTAENLTMYRSEAATIVTALTDRQLAVAYQHTSIELGNPTAPTLLAEIERRGLDI